MRGCEIKQLHWRDIDMTGKRLTVLKSKTEAGERVIPLTADAWDAIVSLYRRSRAFGEVRPEHYVFPACETAHLILRGLREAGEARGGISQRQCNALPVASSSVRQRRVSTLDAKQT